MDNRPKILLVDDDNDFVEATKMVLESKNYNVITASEGESGLRKARDENPDLIILDIIMPVKNGFTAAEEFKKDPVLSRIPVIMLTSFSSKGVGSGIPFGKGLELEAEDYIEKPISPEELLKKVSYLLKQS